MTEEELRALVALEDGLVSVHRITAPRYGWCVNIFIRDPVPYDSGAERFKFMGTSEVMETKEAAVNDVAKKYYHLP